MKQLTFALALLAAGSYVQATPHEHDMHHERAAHETHAAMYQGNGVVKAVKPGKVQIAHEPIPSLQWPAMTMWFEVQGDTGRGIQVGDRVLFGMRQNDRKRWVIERLDKQ